MGDLAHPKSISAHPSDLDTKTITTREAISLRRVAKNSPKKKNSSSSAKRLRPRQNWACPDVVQVILVETEPALNRRLTADDHETSSEENKMIPSGVITHVRS